jgi:hypothetical protein
VFINTAAMTDRAYAEDINRRANALLSEYEPLADVIFRNVKDKLK